jgi:hypothetical protein
MYTPAQIVLVCDSSGVCILTGGGVKLLTDFKHLQTNDSGTFIDGSSPCPASHAFDSLLLLLPYMSHTECCILSTVP